MPQLPVVAIVGKPNVGKSSLLNALVGKKISIVQDMPGVTRDRVSIPLRIDERYVELVDTGGYGFVDPDQLTEHIRHQIELAMAQAQLVLFVVDAQDGLTAADQEIAALLRRKGIKTVLVANKADGPRVDANLADFARLGFGTPVGVSALNDRNLDDLTEIIRRNIDLSGAPTEVPAPQMLVAIVGKRNAGKSTLVNAIAEVYEGHGDRVIVSEVPGTTRDSVDVRFDKDGKTLVVIDTAGVRKKRHMVTNDVEFYSFHRAERSIRRADVVMMLIDGMEPVSEPDKKLAQYIAEQRKPVILVVNKWDRVLDDARKQAEQKKTGFSPDMLMQEFREYLDQELRHLDFAPVAFITAKDGQKVQTVLDLAQHLFKQANERITTHKLNDVVKQVLAERRPSTPSGRKARVYYATQTDVAPPTIVLFVNNPVYLNETYQRFMVNRFRELLPYGEVPIKLVIRQRERQQGPGGGRPRGQGPVVSLDDAADVAPQSQKSAAALGRTAAKRGPARRAPAKPKRPAGPARPRGAKPQAMGRKGRR
jgi:GTP-binding protein